MIGPFLILISWLLLRIEGKGLGKLGFNSPLLRAQQLAAGFGITAAAATIQQLGFAYACGTQWILNPHLTNELLLGSIRWNVNSVLYEELLFRGYILYQAIRFLGPRRAVLLDSAAFGVYHWFTFGGLGNPVAMAFIFLFTGMFGLMLSLAFAKTESVALPIGLHLGWNTVTNVVFSAGPLGATVLIAANGAKRLNAPGLLGLLFGILLPAAVVAGVSWHLTRTRLAARAALGSA